MNEREPRAFVQAVKQSWKLQLEQQQAVQCLDVCDTLPQCGTVHRDFRSPCKDSIGEFHVVTEPKNSCLVYRMPCSV